MAAPVVQFASISPWLWQTGWNAPDAIINGNVLGGPGTDTLVLGGEGTGSFNVGAIGLGLQYQSFEIFLKEGGSHWTLTGTTAAVTPWTINQGTLAISSDANLGAPSGGLAFGGGTLQALASFTSNRTVTLNAGGPVACWPSRHARRHDRRPRRPSPRLAPAPWR